MFLSTTILTTRQIHSAWVSFWPMGSDAQPPTPLKVLVLGCDHDVGCSIADGLSGAGWTVRRLDATAARTQAAARADLGSIVTELGGLDALVVASWNPALTTPKPIESITDADITEGWEASMQTLIWSLQASFPALSESKGRVAVVLPTTAMSGGSHYSLAAASFEAQRILMKATARQWGPGGVRLNAIAIAPESVLDDAAVSDVHYLAPAALGEDRSEEQRSLDLVRAVAFLIGEQSSGLTGQTVGVDGGRWLAP